MARIDDDTRIIDMTWGDLKNLIEDIFDRREREAKPVRLERGLEGIANIFNCSKATAVRRKRTGALDEAITQKSAGYGFTIDVDHAIELWNKYDREKKAAEAKRDRRSHI